MMRRVKVFQKYLGVIFYFVLIVSQTAFAGELLVSWDSNVENDLIGYKVYYGTSSHDYSHIYDVGNTTSYVATDLTKGVEYFFAVTAYDTANNESEYSEEVSAIVMEKDTVPPNQPIITGHTIDGLKITIFWQANNEADLVGYRVYYGTSSGTYQNEMDVRNSTSYTTPDLTVDINYYFAVKAYDTNNNESAYSNEYFVKVPYNDNESPSVPAISNYDIIENKVYLTWNANTESDLAGYKIYYGTTSNTYDVTTDVGKVTNYITPELSPGSTYYFAVTAYDTANNESNYSAEINVLIPDEDQNPPPTPVLTNLQLEEQKVHLYWNEVNSLDLEGYKIYYGTSSRNYEKIVDVGRVNDYIVSDLSEGLTYYFAITSNDSSGNESDFSNEMNEDIPVLDITPPAIYAVEIRDSVLVDLVFSEPVHKLSAENINNYNIDHDISILQVQLDGNQRIVHLTTTAHQIGIVYTLTVNNIKDLAENPNTIPPNSFCTYHYNPDDQTPPIITGVEILDGTHVNIKFSEDIERQSAENEQNYIVNNGITILNAVLDNDLRSVLLTTSAHNNGVTYIVAFNNIKDRAPIPNVIQSNSSIQYTYYEKDDIAPAIYSVEIIAADQLNVIFTEEVEQGSAERLNNYSIDNGIYIINAELDNNLQIVHLTTTAHTPGVIYSITVNNVLDRAFPPNLIALNNKYTYTYAPYDESPPRIILVDCEDATHINVSFSEDIERLSAENESNYQITNEIGVIEASLDHNNRIVQLTTTAHQSGETYILRVTNIKDRAPNPNVIDGENASIAYTYLIEDNDPPYILNVVALNATKIEVYFNEVIERLSAENNSNYQINNGMSIFRAELLEDLQTVTLETTEHQTNVNYTLIANNIKDRAYPPNILENSNYEYNYISGTESDNLIVSNFTNTSYTTGYLEKNDFYYIDRSYVIESIPAEFDGSLWIKTSNEDRSNSDSEFFTFELHQDSKIYVAYDSRAQSVPNWLKNDFQHVNKFIGVSEYAEKLELWERQCTKGKIILGGNLAEGSHGAESMYVILAKVNQSNLPPQPVDTSDPKSYGPANVFLLFQNYPNPFNAGTEIRFQLPENCYVTLTVYNIIGQTVRRLAQGNKQASHHVIHWDGKNSDGHLVPSGVYFSKLEVVRKTTINNKNVTQVVYSDVRKMIFLK